MVVPGGGGQFLMSEVPLYPRMRETSAKGFIPGPYLEPMDHNVNFEKSFSRVNCQKLQINSPKQGVGIPRLGSSEGSSPLPSTVCERKSPTARRLTSDDL